jgi:hypothetical protein
MNCAASGLSASNNARSTMRIVENQRALVDVGRDPSRSDSREDCNYRNARTSPIWYRPNV